MAGHKQPDLPNGFMGQQPNFRSMGLGVLSHPDARINMKEWEGNELKIEICYSDPVKTTWALIEANTKEDRSNCVFSQAKDHTISFLITIPSPGYWKFQIFALPKSDANTSLKGVFNYLIHCPKATKPALPCPTVYKDWEEGMQLKEPMFIHQHHSGPSVRFRLEIPGDPNNMKVAVVVEQEWTHLMHQNGEWVGDVHLKPYYGRNTEVTVNLLRGSESSGSYNTILEYVI